MNTQKSFIMSTLLLLLLGTSPLSMANGDADFGEDNKGLNSFNDYQQPVGTVNAIIHDNRINDNSVNENRTFDSSVNLNDNVIGGNVEIGNNSHNTTINNISVKQSAKQGKS